MSSFDGIEKRLFGKLFNHVHCRTMPLKRSNGSIVTLHHSFDVAGVHLSAHDRGPDLGDYRHFERFTLFSSKRNMLRWRVTFQEIENTDRALVSDSLPQSTGAVLYIKGLPRDDSFFWHAYTFRRATFESFEEHAFDEDWVKLKLFEREWYASLPL